MNQDYSTGNRIVDEVGRINISGNIIPMVWFQAIRYPNGKPNVNAIIILADIVYWYRPTEIRDEITGQVVGRRKKFRMICCSAVMDRSVSCSGLRKNRWLQL